MGIIFNKVGDDMDFVSSDAMYDTAQALVLPVVVS